MRATSSPKANLSESMWQFLLIIVILLIVFGLMTRRPLRFLLSQKREVAGRILDAEPSLVRDDNGSRWVTRCNVEYEAEGRLHRLTITRDVRPALGETVMLTYPVSRPDEAVEGCRQAATRQVIFAVLASLLALLFLLLSRGGDQASVLRE